MREDSEEVIISRIWDNHGKEVGYEQKGVLVRCKDCKYGKWKISELDNKTKGYECAIHAVFENDFGDNGYCSYGERKDNE